MCKAAQVPEDIEAGGALVVAAWRMAAPEYHEAIEAAYADVDPDGERPWWRWELYRVCKRESRCGQYGSPGLHVADGWTGRKSYARAVERGRLDPEECPDHRLGERSPAEFATRGGWGMNAARGLRYLDRCAGPEALDVPASAALVAARAIAACEVDRRQCTCSEHTAMWVGAGVLRDRPLLVNVRRDKRGRLEWGKSRLSTVWRQCGRDVAAAYVLAEVLRAPARWAMQWTAGR